jgi:hypothetical protein
VQGSIQKVVSAAWAAAAERHSRLTLRRKFFIG